MIRCAAAALLMLTSFVAAGQTASGSPELEAASVKPAPPGTPYGGMRGGPGTGSPGQFNYEATTLRGVVARAYGVQRFQIAGPKWFDEDRFDFVGKIPPGTTMAQFQLMLQRLLAERFHLALHRENRTSSVYEMTIAKSGIRMKPAPLPLTPALPAGDAPVAASAALWSDSEGDKMTLRGRGVTMRQILIWLSGETHRDIVDKTELKEAYDFDMSWTLSPSPEPNEPFAADVLGSALEKYLGLKMMVRKVPVETLVIDHLERTPVEN